MNQFTESEDHQSPDLRILSRLLKEGICLAERGEGSAVSY
jgi:hypothetical protein